MASRSPATCLKQKVNLTQLLDRRRLVSMTDQGVQANYDFDAGDEDYGDMIKNGILDPVKVKRTALQNAASIASLMLTTEPLVSGEISG